MELKSTYMTEADETMMSDFRRNHWPDLFTNPPSLYHYTTGDNLIRIIKSGELWTTHIACLNDTTEFVYTFDKFNEIFETRWVAKPRQAINPLLERLKHGVEAGMIVETFSTFVACFSARDDDLSQWRAYAGGEGGYSIQFNPNELGKLNNGALLGRVEYDPDRQTEWLNAICDSVEQLYLKGEGAQRAPNEEAWAKECATYWRGDALTIAPLIKHPDFSAEEEWRIVYNTTIFPSEFRQRNSMMSRHIPLRFGERLPIQGICVGPCRYPEISRAALRDLLAVKEYDFTKITLDVTGIPYRVL